MNLNEKDLKRSETLVKGFGQVKIPVAGNITLLVTLGEGNHSTTKSVTFTVVRFTSAYNGIFSAGLAFTDSELLHHLFTNV